MSESEVKYLITLYELSELNKKVRQIDIAETLRYSKASVSIAMDNLEGKRCVAKDENGGIELLSVGSAIAVRYKNCAKTVEKFLLSLLGSRESVAKSDALKIVCSLSKENYDKLCALSENEEMIICL